MVRDRPNTRHENVSLDFGYTLCWSKKSGVWVSVSVVISFNNTLIQMFNLPDFDLIGSANSPHSTYCFQLFSFLLTKHQHFKSH